MKEYKKRIADDILKRKLEGKGAVLIEGPKWCGKTTTAEQIAKSVLYMDDPENLFLPDLLYRLIRKKLHILEPGDYAYLRSDGVCVVPIGCLKN